MGCYPKSFAKSMPGFVALDELVSRREVGGEDPLDSSIFVDRGAEQGDPLGPFYCAAVIAEIMGQVRARLPGCPFFDV